ncbi:MAG TPA: hypothetical protein VM639_05985 [Dongiaceae bacterium]|nr:hypothetical protein [Dongiaceae bacterium]
MFGFKSFAVAVIVAGTVFTSFPARASSILMDQGDATYDPATHLLWLDITATAGLSYNDVMTNNGVDYIKNGWHYATDFDVYDFYRDAGLPLASNPNGSFFYATNASQSGYPDREHDAYVLGSQLGWTSLFSDDGFSTTGLFNIHQTPRNPATLGVATLFILGYLKNGPDSEFIVDEELDSLTKSDRIPGTGSMLVRNADISLVPIPDGMIPFSLTLFGLTAWNLLRRRQRISLRGQGRGYPRPRSLY